MSTEKITSSEETLIWEGAQSQVLNLGSFILFFIIAAVITVAALLLAPPPLNLLLLALNIIPLAYLIYKIIMVRSVKYRITDQRVISTTGIFSKKTDALELYRIKDLEVMQPFLMRIFGKGKIILKSYDSSNPEFTINAIPSPLSLYDKLRIAVEKRRDLKRVRGVEFDTEDAINF
jgi:uncharacterized membrane protein YdbT with pleckstrin-like domain